MVTCQQMNLSRQLLIISLYKHSTIIINQKGPDLVTWVSATIRNSCECNRLQTQPTQRRVKSVLLNMSSKHVRYTMAVEITMGVAHRDEAAIMSTQ